MGCPRSRGAAARPARPPRHRHRPWPPPGCAVAAAPSRDSGRRRAPASRHRLSTNRARRSSLVQVLVAIGVDHQHRALGAVARQVVQHLRAGVVGPLQVVHHQQRRRPPSAASSSWPTARDRRACRASGKSPDSGGSPGKRSPISGTSASARPATPAPAWRAAAARGRARA